MGGGLARVALCLFLLGADAGTAWGECPPDQREIDGRCVPRAPRIERPRYSSQPTLAPPTASTEAPDAYVRGETATAAAPDAYVRGEVAAAVVRSVPTRARPGGAGQIVPARLLLRSADIPPPGLGGYGIVAFTALPTSESRDRLNKVCEAYTHSLPRQQSLPRTVALRDQMLTIWPIDDPNASLAQADNCAYLTSHYDLYGGQAAIRDARRQGLNLSGRGPYLIAWSPSQNRGVPDKIVLVYDLSDYSSQASFDTMFAFWQNAIIANPSLWRNGVAAAQKRLIFRDFVDSTSQSFLTALHIGSE